MAPRNNRLSTSREDLDRGLVICWQIAICPILREPYRVSFQFTFEPEPRLGGATPQSLALEPFKRLSCTADAAAAAAAAAAAVAAVAAGVTVVAEAVGVVVLAEVVVVAAAAGARLPAGVELSPAIAWSVFAPACIRLHAASSSTDKTCA